MPAAATYSYRARILLRRALVLAAISAKPAVVDPLAVLQYEEGRAEGTATTAIAFAQQARTAGEGRGRIGCIDMIVCFADVLDPCR